MKKLPVVRETLQKSLRALTEKETLDAIDTGVRLVKQCKENGYQILATGEMGIGNTTTSGAVTAALAS